jgi:hypothetical protein
MRSNTAKELIFELEPTPVVRIVDDTSWLSGQPYLLRRTEVRRPCEGNGIRSRSRSTLVLYQARKCACVGRDDDPVSAW